MLEAFFMSTLNLPEIHDHLLQRAPTGVRLMVVAAAIDSFFPSLPQPDGV